MPFVVFDYKGVFSVRKACSTRPAYQLGPVSLVFLSSRDYSADGRSKCELYELRDKDSDVTLASKFIM